MYFLRKSCHSTVVLKQEMHVLSTTLGTDRLKKNKIVRWVTQKGRGEKRMWRLFTLSCCLFPHGRVGSSAAVTQGV